MGCFALLHPGWPAFTWPLSGLLSAALMWALADAWRASARLAASRRRLEELGGAAGNPPPGEAREEARRSPGLLRWLGASSLLIGLAWAAGGITAASDGALAVVGRGPQGPAAAVGVALRLLPFSVFALCAGLAASVIIGVLRAAYDSAARAYLEALSRSLEAAAPKETLQLAPPTAENEQRTERLLGEATRHITSETTRQLAGLEDKLRELNMNIAPRLDEMGRTARDGVTRLEKALEEKVRHAAETLAAQRAEFTAVVRAVATIDGKLTAMQKEVRGPLAEMVAYVHRPLPPADGAGPMLSATAAKLGDAMARIGETAFGLARSAGEIAGKVDRVQSQLAVIDQAGARLDELRGMIGQSAATLAETAETTRLALAETAETTRLALAGLVDETQNGMTQALGQTLEQSRAALSALGDKMQAATKAGAQAISEGCTQTVRIFTGVGKQLDGTAGHVQEVLSGAKAAGEELRRIRAALEGVVAKVSNLPGENAEDDEQIQALSENLEAAHKAVMDQGKNLERLISLARAEQSAMVTTLDRVRKGVEKLDSPTRRF